MKVVQNAKRLCFFCGGSGKTTGEHIWRDKWKKHYGSAPFEAHRWGWRAAGGVAVPYERKFRTKPFSQTLKDVCEKCNRGWMNDLENAVEPNMLELAEGRQVELDVLATQQLIRWAAKTAFIIAAVEGRSPTASTGHKRQVRHGEVPAGIALWILPIPQTGRVEYRTTPLRVPSSAGLVAWHVTSWNFRSVHFLVTHSAVAGMDVLNTYQWVLGKALTDRSEPWICPPPAFVARPDVYPDYHSGLLRHMQQLHEESGITTKIDE